MKTLLIVFSASYLYLFAAALALAYFFTSPKERKKSLALLAIIALPTMYLVSKIAGTFYFDPRPFVTGHFTPLVAHAPDNGFPSDHALLTGAVASIVYPYSKKLSLVLWLLTLAIGTTQVLAGIHHPADILGAMAIAAAVTYLANLALKRQKLFVYPRS